MNKLKEIKILVCIDGSEQAFAAAKYVAALLAGQNVKIVLFHTMQKINDAFFDMGIDCVPKQKMASINAWEIENKKKVKAFMEKAGNLFVEKGFPEKNIKIKSQTRKVGIARDIVIEAGNGYNAVVVGRKGVSKLKDLLFGSVTIKLLEKLSDISLWVIGGEPDTEKILLGLDTSQGAMTAVNYAATIIGSSNKQIGLIYVVRGLNIIAVDKNIQKMMRHENLMEDIPEKINPVFNEARKYFINTGTHPDFIHSKIISEVSSRAAAIIHEAKEGGYGTIILGRRGLSRVEDFFMGRVSNKVISMGKEMAVWIVC